MHPFEFPESSDGCGAQAVHLRPAEVEALARVAGLHAQLLDSPWTAHHGLTALRACPPPFMTDNFARVRKRNSAQPAKDRRGHDKAPSSGCRLLPEPSGLAHHDEGYQNEESVHDSAKDHGKPHPKSLQIQAECM
jgi:hypothetical protein